MNELAARKDNAMKYTILLLAAICFCFASVLSVDAQQRKRRQRPHQKVDSSQKRKEPASSTEEKAGKSGTPAKTITEMAPLVISRQAEVMNGTIRVEARNGDSMVPVFSIDVSVTAAPGKDIALAPHLFELYYSGIVFEFVGTICLPAKGARTTSVDEISVKAEGSGGFGLEEGKIISKGPLKVTGSIYSTIAEGSPVYTITGNGSDHLRLMVLREGFQYVSGDGSVRVPEGKKYSFEKAKNDASGLTTAQTSPQNEPQPKTAKEYFKRAYAYVEKGDLDRAIQDYSQAISLSPRFADAYIMRGLTYDKKGDLDRAIQDYGQAISLKPGDADVYRYRAEVYRALGKKDLADSDEKKTFR